MNNDFFEKPILNSPYAYPSRHWELDDQGQPTQQIVDTRRSAEFITPIPKPKKRKTSEKQSSIVFDEGKGLSTQEQQYDHTAIINAVREHVGAWRKLPGGFKFQVQRVNNGAGAHRLPGAWRSEDIFVGACSGDGRWRSTRAAYTSTSRYP
jgi:hypothetical protein